VKVLSTWLNKKVQNSGDGRVNPRSVGYSGNGEIVVRKKIEGEEGGIKIFCSKKIRQHPRVGSRLQGAATEIGTQTNGESWSGESVPKSEMLGKGKRDEPGGLRY